MSPDSKMRLIDLHHLSRARVIGTYLVDGVLIDPGPSSCLPVLLDALGGERPQALLLTHIHLDHAGASGSLVDRWPELEVYVHERGAPHMVDPSRLIESATRLYGKDMDRLWGEFVAVPPERLRVLRGGERILGERFTVAYTPGHASHHVSYLHGSTAYVGDVGGVRILPGAPAIPPTPPPDIDLEAWEASLQQVAAWRPERLAMTHFGTSEEVEEQLAEVKGRLRGWAELARTHDAEGFIAAIQAEIAAGSAPQIAAAYAQAAPADQLYAGLSRYLAKRAGAGVS